MKGTNVMKLQQIFKVKKLKMTKIKENANLRASDSAEDEEFTKITPEDYKLWVDTVHDMQDESDDIESAMDEMLDNDPKFEALTQSMQQRVIKKIISMYHKQYPTDD
jgi:hypothetical protein